MVDFYTSTIFIASLLYIFQTKLIIQFRIQTLFPNWFFRYLKSVFSSLDTVETVEATAAAQKEIEGREEKENGKTAAAAQKEIEGRGKKNLRSRGKTAVVAQKEIEGRGKKESGKTAAAAQKEIEGREEKESGKTAAAAQKETEGRGKKNLRSRGKTAVVAQK